MQCSKEVIARLFYNVSSSFQLLFIFFYVTSIILSKIFSPMFQRNEDEYIEYAAFSEEEEEEIEARYNSHGEDDIEKDHLVADIIGDGEELSFLSTTRTRSCTSQIIGGESDCEEITFSPIRRSLSTQNFGRSGRSRESHGEELSFLCTKRANQNLYGGNDESHVKEKIFLPTRRISTRDHSGSGGGGDESDGEELSFLGTKRTNQNLHGGNYESDVKEKIFLPTRRISTRDHRGSDGGGGDESDGEELSFMSNRRSTCRDPRGHGSFDSDNLSFYSLSPSESDHTEERIPYTTTRAHVKFSYNANTTYEDPSSRQQATKNVKKSGFAMDGDNHDGKYFTKQGESKKVDAKFTAEENFIIFPPSNLETKRFQVEEKDKEEIFGDTYTVGSTSKSSSEWRSSINNRDYANEDPFSTSSRRSCPKWESYTVFQKYDEEMLFLDRISAQKLHETESLRSAATCPSSLSERIIHKLASRNKSRSSNIAQNPYRELESAYVAQICLTWEALNWNYKYFHQLRASRSENDPGCPAYVAQQFQQFQVLLQRYIENEPYEHGRRPVVYARMRGLAPKLLQVPEYRDSDDEKRDEYLGSRISSDSFQVIMEEAIRTFMNFLKADKENHRQIFTAFFSRNRRRAVDPTLLQLLKKVNQKKKLKIKEVRRAGKCFRKRKLKGGGNEMEILMGLIDLKVVSRVLRMTDLTEEQMHWCENKMTKVKLIDGKLQRDSSPLFFPAH